MDQEHLIRLAPVQERAAGPLDDRHLVPGQEPVHRAGIQRPALAEPVDGELPADRRDRPDRGHAASPRVVMCPSSATMRAPGGGPPPSAENSTRLPLSSRTQRAGANL